MKNSNRLVAHTKVRCFHRKCTCSLCNPPLWFEFFLQFNHSGWLQSLREKLLPYVAPPFGERFFYCTKNNFQRKSILCPKTKPLSQTTKTYLLTHTDCCLQCLTSPKGRGELNRDKMKKETEKIHSLPRKKQKQREKSKENMRWNI